MRTWDNGEPRVWPVPKRCTAGHDHWSPFTALMCMRRYGTLLCAPQEDQDAPPPPSLDVAATDGGGGPRSARRAPRRQAAPVRARLARRAWTTVRDAARYAWDAALEAAADLIAGGSSRAVGGEIRARGDEPVDTVPAWLTGPAATCDQCNDDPATYDPGPTYGWGAGHTGRSWRRWL